MDVEHTPLPGVLLIKPKVWTDARGYFLETWSQTKYADVGIHLPFVQDNHSMSKKHILRGLHVQKQCPQGKLISVSYGTVFDVAVDINPDSSTFAQWFGCILSSENHHQLWIPPGFAHGFCALSEIASLHYKCTQYYSPEYDCSIAWNDPQLAISWPTEHPTLSPKDMNALSLKDYIAKL